MTVPPGASPSAPLPAATPDGAAPVQAGAEGWQPIATAPKDGAPLLGWCVHGADPYHLSNGNLTLYGGHTEGLSHVEDGPHVLVWGGGWDDRTYEHDGGWMPDWWFQFGSEFEVTANPTHWMPITPPSPPSGKERS